MTTDSVDTGYELLWEHGPFECALIGARGCPIIKRWTLRLPTRVGALRLHWFYPNTADRDPHDHPWPFGTLVVWGHYTDINHAGRHDRLRPGSFRWRSALHTHQTVAGSRGCVTLVFTRPDQREWGFWRGAQWLHYKVYKQLFGAGMVCEPDRDEAPS